MTPLSPDEVFYVGGQYVQDDPGGPTCMVGQMCVRRYGPSEDKHHRPAVIFIHGAAQTGTHFEVTPDGRPGLALLHALDGWVCYVVDQPGIGRSRYHASTMGELTHYPVEQMEAMFTSPRAESWPQAKLHNQWPGTGRKGDAIFDAFYASQVGHIKDYSMVEKLFRAAARALLERTGAAFLVTHSQSGPIGWQAADECPERTRGIVALEPHGPPFVYPNCPPFSAAPDQVGKLTHPFGITSTPLHYTPPLPPEAVALPFEMLPVEEADQPQKPRQTAPVRKLSNLVHIPILVITAEASYHTLYDHLTVDFLREGGVPAEHVYLADVGIRGNGHLMAIEANNVQIQQLIHGWMAKQSASS